MPLEQPLYPRLTTDPALAAALASWSGLPAVFERMAPDDTSPGWDGPQYPRIVYIVDRDNNFADVLTGTLRVQVWGRADHPELVDQVIQRLGGPGGPGLLDDAAVATVDEGLVVLNWQTANPFNGPGDEAERVFGVELTYGLRAFDAVTTYAPDPVAALNRFTAQTLDSRLQVAPEVWSPSDQSPAIYWRPISRTTPAQDETFWGFWVNVRIEGHVLAPSIYARANWIRLVSDALRSPKNRFICLEDNSPLRIMVVTEDFNVSPYAQGQIKLDVRYGVLTSEILHAFPLPPTAPAVPGAWPIGPDGQPIPPQPVGPVGPNVPPPGVTTLPPNLPATPNVDTNTGQKIDHYHTRGAVTINK